MGRVAREMVEQAGLDVNVLLDKLVAAAGGHLQDLAHGDQLVQGVVHGGQADLGQALLGAAEDGLGREVHVLAVQHLGHHPTLGGEPPPPGPEPFEQVADVGSLRRRFLEDRYYPTVPRARRFLTLDRF